MNTQENLRKVRECIAKERNTAKDINVLFNSMQIIENAHEKNMAENQLKNLKVNLIKINQDLLKNLESLNIKNSLVKGEKGKDGYEINTPKLSRKELKKLRKIAKITPIEKVIIERMKKSGKKGEKKEEKSSDGYKKFAEKKFSSLAKAMIKTGFFQKMGADIVKSNLNYNLISYLSMTILNLIIAFVVGLCIFLFFLFFNLSPLLPVIVPMEDPMGLRLAKVFWILLVIPGVTALFMKLYPSMEAGSIGKKIEAELPFAVIHMAAISGSMINPIKIFSIISATREYPHLEKEFNKLLNEINVYGYDLVTSLKDIAINSPSKKLAELFNGLSTTITSGGTLYEFFEKRSQSLLFEYKLDNEKNTKSSESFMDIYISIVIAAPMVLMLLLMMMKISGLGISLATNTITLLVVGGVSLVNILFLAFLQVKQQATA